MKEIRLDIDNKDEYINKFNDQKISDSLHDYLDKIEIIKSKDYTINIRFKYEHSKQEEHTIKELLHNEFNDMIELSKDELKSIFEENIIYLLIGSLFLMMYYFICLLNSKIFSEITLVISWVLVWQIGDNIFLKRKKIVKKLNKYKKLLNCPIEIIK